MNEGETAIRATVTGRDGDTSSTTIAVVESPASALDEVAVTFSTSKVFAPGLLVIRLLGNEGRVASVSVDFDGNGSTDVVDNTYGRDTEIAWRYTQPGVVLVRVTLADFDGNARSFQYPVLVTTIGVEDAQLRAVINGMFDALRAGNTEAALKFFVSSRVEQQRAIFNSIGANMPDVIARFGTIADGQISTGLAEYLIVRDLPDGKRGYLVYLLQEEDGVWRIAQM
ncbi:MAG: hypothetical protein JNK75_05565 [Betaproteobacteria bacterium]|nr:hypothetical protein [Betaproteobacteria bacterium]